MEKAWLAERLTEGLSIAAIAREAGKGASTVAYWINKHGLVAAGRERHAPRGPIDEAVLRGLVEEGRSVREIAHEVGLSPTATRYHLRRCGLTTQPARRHGGTDKPPAVMRECATHGWTAFHPTGARRYYRCGACNTERVAARRRSTKEILVAEAGGRCGLCGYDRYAGALQFHHLDPPAKRFDIGGRGLTRNLSLLREEARRCVLLCGNCHAEVEAGVTRLPFRPQPAD